jgi:thymidylate synthase (FAD)
MSLVVRVIAHTKFIGVPAEMLPAEGYLKVQEKGQDVGTDAERLIECAARACYDSMGNGRPSAAHHKHIMEVNHGSVTEHASLSFFIGGVSRGLTHELVRHRVGVAISQRSTRYVDENESPWAWHPLISEFLKAHPEEIGGFGEGRIPRSTFVVQETAQNAYRQVVEQLQVWLISKGADKFTARKQARGAARGLLGNALTTELVWTANCRALKTVLDQRAKGAADAEIRLLANRLYEEALPYWPSYLGCYQKRDCPDGIGYELYIPDKRDSEIVALKAELGIMRELTGTKKIEVTKP